MLGEGFLLVELMPSLKSSEAFHSTGVDLPSATSYDGFIDGETILSHESSFFPLEHHSHRKVGAVSRYGAVSHRWNQSSGNVVEEDDSFQVRSDFGWIKFVCG